MVRIQKSKTDNRMFMDIPNPKIDEDEEKDGKEKKKTN